MFPHNHRTAPDTIVICGGDTKLHARAQEASWAEMLTFLRKSLAASPEDTGSSKAFPTSTVDVQATPASALVDDVLYVCVTGLQLNENVTLTAIVEERGCFLSHAHSTANHNGEVHLAIDSSCGGSYEGEFGVKVSQSCSVGSCHSRH